MTTGDINKGKWLSTEENTQMKIGNTVPHHQIKKNYQHFKQCPFWTKLPRLMTTNIPATDVLPLGVAKSEFKSSHDRHTPCM